MEFKYKKAIVLGNNGSGKSYFSKRLSEITGLPLIHLDLLYWKENWTHPNRDEWAEIQRNLVANKQWVIDGMHISTLEIRFEEADVIYFLDIDISVCIESIRQRQTQERTDFPNYLDKKQGDFETFERGVFEFEERRKPRIIELHNKYLDKDFIVFKTREEVDSYLKKIEQ